MATVTLYVPGIGPVALEEESQLCLELTYHSSFPADWQYFLMRPDEWPEDAYGNEFLANALNRIGQSMFPEAWTGHELAARPLDSLEASMRSYGPGRPHPLSGEVVAAVADIVGEPFTAVGTDSVLVKQLVQAYSRRPQELEQIANIGVARSQVRELLQPAISRADAVRDRLRRALRDGFLNAVPLPAGGGLFGPEIEKEVWNQETARYRLTTCTINPEAQRLISDAPPTHWIFVSASGVEAVIKELLPQRSAPKAKMRDAHNFGDHLVAHVTTNPDRAERKEEWQAIAKLEFGVGTKAFRREWEDAMTESRKDQPEHKWGTNGRGKAPARSGLKPEPDKP